MTDRFVGFLKKYLAHNDEALLWVLSFLSYIHAIDDIIDNPIKDNEHILKTFEFAAVIYSSRFYWEHIHILYPLVKFAGNSYMDSLVYEKSQEKWKNAMGDVIRQEANNVILAVIEVVNGLNVRREASLEIREISYWLHHTPEGKPC